MAANEAEGMPHAVNSQKECSFIGRLAGTIELCPAIKFARPAGTLYARGNRR